MGKSGHDSARRLLLDRRVLFVVLCPCIAGNGVCTRPHLMDLRTRRSIRSPAPAVAAVGNGCATVECCRVEDTETSWWWWSFAWLVAVAQC
eukprot:scaffold3869_cov111-Isochrysis_galbana.AAC.4